MNRRAQTNHQLYQARLMLDLIDGTGPEAREQAALDASVVFLYRAWCAALAEVGEVYGLSLRADEPVKLLLDRLGEQRPDAWEYRTVREALNEPGHWMAELKREAEQWAFDPGAQAAKPSGDDLIASVADDNEDHTNYYRRWLSELQQWVDEVRSLSDYS